MGEYNKSFFEDFLTMGGLLLVQGLFGFYTIFLNRILAVGFDPLFLIVSGNFLAALLLLPLACLLDRNKWPKRITAAMMVQFSLIALGGTTMFQGLLLMGIKRTTPAIASAMPNLIPGFVFIIAASLRFERFSIWCKYSQAKVVGTIVCLGGAIAMSLMQSPSATKALFLLGGSIEDSTAKDWMRGCFFLFAAVIIGSFIMVLQAATLVIFPAPFSLCVITSLMGSIFTLILQIIAEGKINIGSPNLSIFFIFVIIITGSLISTPCVAYQTWCVGRKGPLLVSIFSPIQTMCATSLSMILFGQSINLGSSIGMLTMIIGLYVVLWAKRRERFEIVEDDTKMPLLS